MFGHGKSRRQPQTVAEAVETLRAHLAPRSPVASKLLALSDPDLHRLYGETVRSSRAMSCADDLFFDDLQREIKRRAIVGQLAESRAEEWGP